MASSLKCSLPQHWYVLILYGFEFQRLRHYLFALLGTGCIDVSVGETLNDAIRTSAYQFSPYEIGQLNITTL